MLAMTNVKANATITIALTITALVVKVRIHLGKYMPEAKY